MPEQLGLKVNVGPEAVGPFEFGTSTRVSSGKTIRRAHSASPRSKAVSGRRADVADASRRISQEILGIPGFISLVTATVGDRRVTIIAWESPNIPGQLMRAGTHPEAVGDSSSVRATSRT